MGVAKTAASLAPGDARHEVVEGEPGSIVITQVDRPPLVLHTLHIPCACGRPLVGCDFVIYGSDEHNGTVVVRGVCLTCGVQTAIFAPPLPAPTQTVAKARELQAEVETMLSKIRTLREGMGLDDPQESVA